MPQNPLISFQYVELEDSPDGVPIMTHPTVNANLKSNIGKGSNLGNMSNVSQVNKSGNKSASAAHRPGFQVFRSSTGNLNKFQHHHNSREQLEIWLHGPR